MNSCFPAVTSNPQPPHLLPHYDRKVVYLNRHRSELGLFGQGRIFFLFLIQDTDSDFCKSTTIYRGLFIVAHSLIQALLLSKTIEILHKEGYCPQFLLGSELAKVQGLVRLSL